MTARQQQLAKEQGYKTISEMNNTRILYQAKEYIVGTCCCSRHLNIFKGPKSDCIYCIQRFTIYADDKYYNRLVEMFLPLRVREEKIQELYIMFGKDFSATKEAIKDEHEIEESEIIDKIQEYDEVEIVENITIPEKPDITIPVYDELPAPIILGKRQREVYVPAPEALLEEEEEISFYDGITGELIQENPPAKKQRILSQYEELIKSQIVECSIVGAMAHTYYKLKHNYFKQCKFIF